MAASLTLLPLDQSLLHGSTKSEEVDVSSARQRRRRTVKKPETQSLTKIRGLGEGECNGRELNRLESSAPARNWPGMRADSSHSEGQHPDYREDIASAPVEPTSLPNAARRRQRHSRRAKQSQPKHPPHFPQTVRPEDSTARLGDSTDGVVAILETRLDQPELDESRREVTTDRTLTTPRSDQGHSSGIVTESEEDGSQPQETTASTGSYAIQIVC